MDVLRVGILPFGLQSLLDQEIDDGEQLLWSAQPSASRAVIKALPGIAFGVIFCAVPSFIMWQFLKDAANGKEFPIVPLIFLSVFLLVGLLLMTSPYWAARKAKNTVYVITDKRAITITKGSSVSVQSFGPDKLQDIIKRIRSDGSGDLIFERHVNFRRSGRGGTRQKVTEIGFFGIPQVNEVEDLLKQIWQE